MWYNTYNNNTNNNNMHNIDMDANNTLYNTEHNT